MLYSNILTCYMLVIFLTVPCRSSSSQIVSCPTALNHWLRLQSSIGVFLGAYIFDNVSSNDLKPRKSYFSAFSLCSWRSPTRD